MIVTPNTRGHYPAGYPRTSAGGSSAGYDVRELETATDRPDLAVFRTAMEESASDASNYFRRIQDAQSWWGARWPGQTIDGRKWTDDAFPWPGASDTRVRLIERVMGQFLT